MGTVPSMVSCMNSPRYIAVAESLYPGATRITINGKAVCVRFATNRAWRTFNGTIQGKTLWRASLSGMLNSVTLAQGVPLSR